MERKITPLVVLGASAGGLEAFENFFLSIPPTSGFAYIVLAHLSPNHISILPELLQRKTEMKVVPIKSGIKIIPNSVYVIPPNKILSIKDQNLFLKNIDSSHRVILPIDNFFVELAKNYKNNTACIILSGTGTDGTIGLKEIKKAGGLTIAQDPKSSKYEGMPNSAISGGIVDYVLPPEKMYEKLMIFFGEGKITIQTKPTVLIDKKIDDLQQINILLYSETVHDFSHYKKNTILRRIERRTSIYY